VKDIVTVPSEQIGFLPSRSLQGADASYTCSVQNTSTDWQQVLQIIKKHWLFSVLFAAIIFSAIAIVTYSITPSYESTARLEVDPPGSEAFSLATSGPGGNDEDYRDTQSEILRSDELAIAVIRKLHLDSNPAIVGKKVLAREVSPARNHATDQIPRESVALRYFRDHVNISLVRKSRVLEVKFTSADPRLAAQVVNCLVDMFIERNFRARYDAIMRASEWLERQMDDIRQKADSSNQALAAYQKAHGIVDVDEKQSSVSQQITDLNHELTQAKTDRIQLEAYLKGIRDGHPESLPQIRQNAMLQALTQNLIESKADLVQAQTIYGEKSPNVQKLKHRVHELQDQILAEQGKIAHDIETNYEAARARENLMSQEIKGATNEMSEMAQYISLKREAQRDADLYNLLYTRVKEAGITAASKSSNVRVVDTARVSDTPARPRRVLNLSLGLVLGILGGILMAFVREGFDNSIRSAEDIEKWTGLPSLTLVPTAALMASRNSVQIGLPAASFFGRPLSPEAEAVRSLQASILLSNQENPPRLLLVSSPFAKEGKTTVAINLAVALSQSATTCLVDADLRTSGVASALHLKSGRGLSDVLKGSITVREALVGMPHSPRLTLLPAGSPPAGVLDQLLVLDRIRCVVRELSKYCQYVVIDSPPLVPFADGRVLSSVVDGVILVVRYASTSRQAIARCTQMLNIVRAPVLGVVLNDVDLTSVDFASSYSMRYNRT